MKRQRRRVLAFVVPFTVALAPVAACGTNNATVDKGGECALASDCAPGLICIAQKGTRVCSDDLSSVAGKPPPEAGADVGEGGLVDQIAQPDRVVPPDAPVDTGTDTGIQDAGTDG